MTKIKQQDIWELILQTESELKRIGSTIQPLMMADDVMNSIVNEPSNKISEMPVEIRHKMRIRFAKRYGWNV